MISYIKGTVESISIDSIVVECNGIGYEVYFANTHSVSISQIVQIYTYEHIREDEHSLYGFLSKAEKELFLKLLSVKGVGPKTVLAMLRNCQYDQIINAIELQDVAFIKSMPGIGAKTASQIILDLKGKLVDASSSSNISSPSKNITDAVDALKSLGYKQAECAQVSKYLSTIPDKSVDEYVKLALQYLLSLKR